MESLLKDVGDEGGVAWRKHFLGDKGGGCAGAEVVGEPTGDASGETIFIGKQIFGGDCLGLSQTKVGTGMGIEIDISAISTVSEGGGGNTRISFGFETSNKLLLILLTRGLNSLFV